MVTKKKIPAGTLSSGHTLVGECDGLSAVFEVEPSSAMPGLIHVTTEHGPLYLDPDEDCDVLVKAAAA